jgi:DNA ligase-4
MDSLANEGLSLGLVFFDILFLDFESLLSRSYADRRELLESLLKPSPGKAILAQRYLIDMRTNPGNKLYRIFSEHIAACQEGLVLKAEDSRYNDYRKPWVKIKRDYLPGAGDKLDLVIVGAAWEKVRGRSLRGE